jgi:hypothetical protein
VKRPWKQYLKQVARKTGSDSYRAMKKWLPTIPDGKCQPIRRMKDKKKIQGI